MFKKIKLRDLLKIHPRDFDDKHSDTIMEAVCHKYVNKVRLSPEREHITFAIVFGNTHVFFSTSSQREGITNFGVCENTVTRESQKQKPVRGNPFKISCLESLVEIRQS